MRNLAHTHTHNSYCLTVLSDDILLDSWSHNSESSLWNPKKKRSGQSIMVVVCCCYSRYYNNVTHSYSECMKLQMNKRMRRKKNNQK